METVPAPRGVVCGGPSQGPWGLLPPPSLSQAGLEASPTWLPSATHSWEEDGGTGVHPCRWGSQQH